MGFYAMPVLAFGIVNCHHLRLSMCMCPSIYCPRDNASNVPARTIKCGHKKSTKFAEDPCCLGVDLLWPTGQNVTSFQSPAYLHRFCVLKHLWYLHRNGNALTVPHPKWLGLLELHFTSCYRFSPNYTHFTCQNLTTFGNRRNNSKLAPISLYFVQLATLG